MTAALPPARYLTGPATAVVGPNAMALVAGDDAPVIEDLRAAVDAVDPIAAVVDALLRRGPADLPAFGIVVAGDPARAFLRGPIEVRFRTDAQGTREEGSGSLDGRDAVTWREETLPPGATVTLCLVTAREGRPDDDPAADAFTIVGGTAPAAWLSRLFTTRSIEPTPPAAPASAAATEPERAAAPNGPPPVTPPPIATPVTSHSEDDDFDFAHLLGDTRHRSAEEAAVRTIVPEEVDPPPPTPPPTDLAGNPADVTRHFSDDEPLPQGLISAVPGVSARLPPAPPPAAPLDSQPAPPPAPPPLPPPPEAVDPDDQEEHTQRRVPSRSDGPLPTAGPTVQAVHCAEGHPNPPHTERCRRCTRPITDRSVRTIPRPSLGRLLLPSGNSIELTRPLLIGRKPPPNAIVGGEPAASIAMKDPEKLLSRIHLEVRFEEWQVQLVDRDSMNHTYIEVPGQPPRQLRPADPHPIPPGTVINLADAIRLTYVVEDP